MANEVTNAIIAAFGWVALSLTVAFVLVMGLWVCLKLFDREDDEHRKPDERSR